MRLEKAINQEIRGRCMMRRLLLTLSACSMMLAVLVGGCGVLSLRDHRSLAHRRLDVNKEMRSLAIISCDTAIFLADSFHRRQPGTESLDRYFGPGRAGFPDRNWIRPYYFHH